MSYLLPHLHSERAVDQAILAEEERLVIIRFGHNWDETCMKMDEVLASVAETMRNYAVIYLVDITEVPNFNFLYEMYDPSTIMFFFRNQHMMIDLGVGNKNNMINWAMKDKKEFIDIVAFAYYYALKLFQCAASPATDLENGCRLRQMLAYHTGYAMVQTEHMIRCLEYAFLTTLTVRVGGRKTIETWERARNGSGLPGGVGGRLRTCGSKRQSDWGDERIVAFSPCPTRGLIRRHARMMLNDRIQNLNALPFVLREAEEDQELGNYL
ncbi:hypothetical protein Vadar_020633 [Vaccinium darrowii]|uniref:Uncharacterized protein n=1 Tax=Vaccinium darrowii TaxID=229202 RepID=A0ACB7ZLV8_9ERIC|nr:hypothetical protein Vadar_020633 [Vaccinium darrowii]